MHIIDEVAAGQEKLRQALGDILTAFGQVEGLGSLLNVKGTLAELVDDVDGQLGIFDDADQVTLPGLLDRLHGAVAEETNGSSFRAKDLRSFLRLLVILSQNYDVALMNPPYGSRTKMPLKVRDYVKRHYEHVTDYFVNFFELAERLSKKNGRIGLLIPHQFMFNSSFSNFRDGF